MEFWSVLVVSLQRNMQQVANTKQLAPFLWKQCCRVMIPRSHDFGMSSPRLDSRRHKWRSKSKIIFEISTCTHIWTQYREATEGTHHVCSLCLESMRSKHTPTLQKLWYTIQKCSRHPGFSCSAFIKTKTLRRVSKKLSVVVHESMNPKRLIKTGFQRSNSSQLQNCRNRRTASKKLGVKVTASKSPSKEQSSESWSQSPRKWTCPCSVSHLQSFHFGHDMCIAYSQGEIIPNLSKSHQTSTEIADPSPTITRNIIQTFWHLQRWSPRSRTAVTKMDVPGRELSPLLKPSHIFCQNLSQLKVNVHRRLGVGTTHIHIQITNTEVVLMLGQVLVFTLHMFEPLRLGQVQNQKSQQSPRVHHTYTAPRHHLNFPHSKPQNNSTSPRCRVPKSTRPMVGPTPCIKSTSSSTEEKKQTAAEPLP